ncbi:Hypothetical protein RY70_1959 [Bifidobacterium bifidum]|nr:Hypothetical protein RY70_1959 [Bifidobacterium bifidum]
MRVCVSYVVFLLLRIGVRHRGGRHVCCDRSGDDGDVIVSAVNVRPCGDRRPCGAGGHVVRLRSRPLGPRFTVGQHARQLRTR